MTIFQSIRATLKAMTLEEKLNMVVDILCGIGSATIGADIGKRLSVGHKPLTRVCIRTTCSALGMAAGNVACKQLKSTYVKPIAALASKAKEKTEEAKEEEVNG